MIRKAAVLHGHWKRLAGAFYALSFLFYAAVPFSSGLVRNSGRCCRAEWSCRWSSNAPLLETPSAEFFTRTDRRGAFPFTIHLLLDSKSLLSTSNLNALCTEALMPACWSASSKATVFRFFTRIDRPRPVGECNLIYTGRSPPVAPIAC